jgi:hypothetical protein
MTPAKVISSVKARGFSSGFHSEPKARDLVPRYRIDESLRRFIAPCPERWWSNARAAYAPRNNDARCENQRAVEPASIRRTA